VRSRSARQLPPTRRKPTALTGGGHRGSPPRVDIAQAKNRSHSSYRPRSAASACTSRPAFAISRAAAAMHGSEIDVTQSQQSSASSDSATARPSPRLAAVTRASLPRRPSSMTLCQSRGRARCRRSRRFATLPFAAIGPNTSCSSQVQQLHLGPPEFMAASGACAECGTKRSLRPHLGWADSQTASQSQRCRPAAGPRTLTVRRLPMDVSHGAPCPDTEAVIACLNVTDA